MRQYVLLLPLACSCAPSIRDVPVATVDVPPTESELLLQRKDTDGLTNNDTLTFVYEGEAKTVEVCCGLQESLERLPDSDVWTLSKTIPNLSEAVISYFFIVDGVFPQTQGNVWRGLDAPPLPETLEPSPERVFERTLQSGVLDEVRKLVIYLPPDHDALKLLGLPVVYLADGSSVWEYASYVEPLIKQGKLPQLLLIGIESGGYTGDPSKEYDPQLDLRVREYIPDEKDDRFADHERFVIEEVLPWAEENFGASRSRDQRVVYGHSNGGVFAAAMGLKKPDIFGYALPFSVGVDPTETLGLERVDTKFYFVAGQLEEGFLETTRDLSERLSEEGISSEFRERVAGHDFVMWQEAFPEALLWFFGLQPPN